MENRLELQTLGSQPIMPKNLPDYGFYLVTMQFHMVNPWDDSQARADLGKHTKS